MDPQLKAAAQAAGQATVNATVQAIQVAASNAGKPGGQSSEFKAIVGGVLATGLIAGLHVLSVVPGPWMLPALAVSTGISVAGYAIGRSRVKSAALQSAAQVVTWANQPPTD